jgi:signal transduction histidine kinase
VRVRTDVPGRETWFLPADRTDPGLLAAEIAHAAQSAAVTALLEASEAAAAVLDARRQVVAFNPAFLIAAGVEEPSRALGLRPGEALGCVYVEGKPAGCGTTEACPTCGAALAILSATRSGRPVERRCALSVRRGGARVDREFRARATPIRIEGEPFLLLTLRDVTAEARRLLMERSHLHELGSLAFRLESATERLEPGAEAAAEDVRLLAQQLAHEVRLQRFLSDGASADEKRAARRSFEVSDAISLLRRTLERHPALARRRVEWPRVPTGLLVPADPAMLHAVLMNMVLNALDAAPTGRIRVEVAAAADRTCIRVWNPGAIPAAVAPRIFQRHFSTRSEPGRGHGTWSMKVFGEDILGGQVSFRTSPVEGTTFEIAFPRQVS